MNVKKSSLQRAVRRHFQVKGNGQGQDVACKREWGYHITLLVMYEARWQALYSKETWGCVCVQGDAT